MNSLTPPNVYLQPGQSGPNVTQLQQWLISMGFSIPDGATGFYGPETKAAVTQLQQQLGVDNSSGPGYWGPRTVTAVDQRFPELTKQASDASSTPTPPTPTNSPQTNGSMQQALLGAIGDVAKTNYSTTGAQLTLADALKLAKNDPDIIAKYSDALKLDTKAFQQNIANLQASSDLQNKGYKDQFEQDRKNLSETEAAAGRAYSGFRQQAETRLGNQESSVIQSSRSKLKSDVDQMTSAFEAKYGTSATTSMNLSFSDPLANVGVSLSGLNMGGGTATGPSNITGELAGGITGTAPISQKQDVQSKAVDLMNLAQTPAQ